MEVFAKNHEVIINLFLGIVQAASTIILFLITISYARTTKRIAVLTREDYESTNRSFIFIEDFIKLTDQQACRLMVGNSGKFPAQVKIKGIEISCYTTPSTTGFNKSLMDIFAKGKMGYFIFPNQENGKIGVPFIGDVLDNIFLSDGFFLTVNLEYHLIGKPNSKPWTVSTLINFKTQRGTLNGKIHDLQTIDSN
ncbi:MAG: hypothetical protein ABI723_27055 [Bacteroidia bacterium]